MRWRMFALAAAVLMAGCAEEVNYPDRKAPEGMLDNPEQQAVGRAIFEQKCTFCHGTMMEGRNPRADSYRPRPSDLTAAGYRDKDPAYLYWRIARGKQVEPFRSEGSVMPAWGPHLSERQIWQLVAYIRSRAAG